MGKDAGEWGRGGGGGGRGGGGGGRPGRGGGRGPGERGTPPNRAPLSPFQPSHRIGRRIRCGVRCGLGGDRFIAQGEGGAPIRPAPYLLHLHEGGTGVAHVDQVALEDKRRDRAVLDDPDAELALVLFGRVQLRRLRGIVNALDERVGRPELRLEIGGADGS